MACKSGTPGASDDVQEAFMILRNAGRLNRLGLLLIVLGALATIPVIGTLAVRA